MININGIDYIQCDLCDRWRDSNQLCKCINEPKNEQLERLLEVGRAKNRHIVFVTPKNLFNNHNQQQVVRKNDLRETIQTGIPEGPSREHIPADSYSRWGRGYATRNPRHEVEKDE